MKKNIAMLLAFTSFLVTNGQNNSSKCYVWDDLTVSERKNLGISDESFTQLGGNSLTNILNLNNQANYITTNKKFRVHFWCVRNTSNTEGAWLSYDMAVKYINDLNTRYKAHNICFVLNGVGTLFDDNAIHGGSHGSLRTLGEQKNAYFENVINVYIAPSLTGGAYGITNYFSNSVAVKSSAMWGERGLLAHEIGHALSLMHTHGPDNAPPNGNVGTTTGCERVTRDPNDPNYNATTAGDKVADTAADPGLNGNVANQYYNTDSNCNYFGNLLDCGGDLYVPDSSVLNNVMAYNPDSCRVLFTPGQAARIHANIDAATPYATHIKNALITNDNDFDYDLFIRDGEEDNGQEKNTLTTNFWTSPDIWIRKVDDDSPYHENPEYGSSPNYVYVRVVNRGCSPSDGTGKIKLYWSKAGTNLPYKIWDGTYNLNGVEMGGEIGEYDLPVMDSYEERIFKFEWNVPDPIAYSGVNEPWHFCLMAKVESPTDIPAFPELVSTYYDFLNSNNLALKNVHVTNVSQNNKGRIHLSNFNTEFENYKLKIKTETLELVDANIFDEAEVRLKFSPELWNNWVSSGSLGDNFTIVGDETLIINDNTEIIIKEFTPESIQFLDVEVNFLTQLNTSNNKYGFHIIHENFDNELLIGGEYFEIIKEANSDFNASYTVNDDIITANDINQPAIFNWYNSNNTLVHTGNSFLNNKNEDLLLEVKSLKDGFKDYKLITYKENYDLKGNIKIYPNPTSSILNIEYDNSKYSNSYISLVKIDSNKFDNYIFDSNSKKISIDVSGKKSGIYRLLIVCDNKIMESHNIQIE